MASKGSVKDAELEDIPISTLSPSHGSLPCRSSQYNGDPPILQEPVFTGTTMKLELQQVECTKEDLWMIPGVFNFGYNLPVFYVQGFFFYVAFFSFFLHNLL